MPNDDVTAAGGWYIFENIVFVAAGWTVLLPRVFQRSKSFPLKVEQPTPWHARHQAGVKR